MSHQALRCTGEDAMPIERILRKVTTTLLVVASLAVGCWVATRAGAEPVPAAGAAVTEAR
jgi:hypothetical protein